MMRIVMTQTVTKAVHKITMGTCYIFFISIITGKKKCIFSNQYNSVNYLTIKSKNGLIGCGCAAILHLAAFV